jgi:hypothetical protein
MPSAMSVIAKSWLLDVQLRGLLEVLDIISNVCDSFIVVLEGQRSTALP